MVLPVVAQGRAAAERLMLDRCVVRRPTDELVTDPITFEVTRRHVVVYGPDSPKGGMCKVQSHEAFEQERESAAATVIVNRVRVDVPVGVGPFKPGDVVTILDSVDPQMVGRHLRMTVEGPYKTHATAYRIAAEVVVDAEVPEWQG